MNKNVKSNTGGENYGRFTKSSQHPNAFTLFLREHGIITNYTILETLEQNGVTEQHNRTLIDIMISIISNSTLLEFLSGKVLKTVIHILNRVPSKTIHKTPYKL